MPSKHRSSIIKNQDVAAVTFVVGSDLEVADFTTLADAVANIPAEGGAIALLEGAHPFTPSGTLPANLKIVGAGIGASEIVLGGAVVFGLSSHLQDLRVSGAFTVTLASDFHARGVRFSSAVVIPTASSRLVLIGNRLDAVVARSIDIASGSTDAVIEGNIFSGFTSETIRTSGTGAIVTGNKGCRVLEVAPANDNRYDENSGFSGSTITGADSTVNGAKRAEVVSGATSDGFAVQFAHANQKGLLGVGTVKNKDGLDSMDVKETAVDFFGTTDSVTTVVLFGNSLLLSAQVNIATARPPYKSYQVEVRSTVPGSPASFDLEYVSHGAE